MAWQQGAPGDALGQVGEGRPGCYVYVAIESNSGEMFEEPWKTELGDLREKVIPVYLPGPNHSRWTGNTFP